MSLNGDNNVFSQSSYLVNSYNALSTLVGIGDTSVNTNNDMPTIARGAMEDTVYYHSIQHEGPTFLEGDLEFPQAYERTL